MEFRLLGALEVTARDRRIQIGGAKPRALLAMLLLHPNEVISSDRLIDALWGAEPPPTATKALQVHVSQLRKVLAGDVISTLPSGYVLELDGSVLDVQRFRALAEEGRATVASDPARGRALLAEGLALWRGPPLADFAYERFAQAHIARLEEQRIGAIEDRVEADLALGRHAGVVGELESLIAEHPHRERLRAHHMVALYRSGRQAEALDAYQDARRVLTDELGIEPGRELRELQQAILSQDAALDHHPLAAEEPARPHGAFVGRGRELAELAGALDDALAGRGRLVLLAGEPGIGKSRLADELIAGARGEGAQVLVGRCWEAGGAPAYWPWVQSLRAYVRAADPGALREQLGAGAADLAQLLPELRALFPDLPEPPGYESEGARFRLFEAVSSFLRSAARHRPLLIVLDDLHAGDEPSLLMLRFVARELGDSRLLVAGAYRDVDPTIGPALGATLAELVGEPDVVRITLGGLGEADLAEYIEASTGIVPAPLLVQAIQGETEGNPLFVAETVRLLAAEGRLAEADAHLRIPPSVRAVIGRRVGRLSERCRGLLVSASILGREFALDTLGRLSAMPTDELLDTLDEAMSERVIGDLPGSPGRLRFGHALIRDALYDELTTARRCQLHRDAARALEATYSADVEPHLTELAEHYFAAAPAGVADEAVHYARRAADRAAAQLAFEEAVRLFRMALAFVSDPVVRCELLLAMGDAQGRSGDTPSSKESLRAAAEIAEHRGLTDHLARAALGYGGRLLWEVSRDDDFHAVLLERALEALGDADSMQRVRVLARFAGGPLRDATASVERRLALAAEALAMARRIGDPATLAYALSGYTAANHSPDYTRTQVDVSAELIEVAMDAGELERAAEGHEHHCVAMIELGDTTAAKADLAAMAAIAQELRQPSQDWFVAVYETHLALIEARLPEAEVHMAAARSLGARAAGWSAEVTYRLQLYLLRREQGRLAEVEELIRRSVDDYPTYPIWRCVLAQTSAELGKRDEARAVLESLAADGYATLPFDEEWLASLCLLGETAVATGQLEHAAVLYELLAPYADRVAISYPEISIGTVSGYLGLLATAIGRLDAAGAHFEEATALAERIGAPSWLARAERDFATMLEAGGGTGA